MALQVLAVAQVTWRDLSLQSLQIWVLAVALVVGPLAVWLARGRLWAWRWLVVFASVWILVSIVAAIRLSSFWLGLETLLLVVFWYGVLTWVRLELDRAYMGSSLKWYMGRPRPLPGLVCELTGPDTAPQRLSVSGLDAFGACVALPAGWPRPGTGKRWRRLRAKFSTAKQSFKGRVEVVTVSLDQSALGLRFRLMSPDRLKSLRDFLESARGGGYV